MNFQMLHFCYLALLERVSSAHEIDIRLVVFPSVLLLALNQIISEPIARNSSSNFNF